MDSSKVYTPVPLAKGIVAALGDSSNAKWLEPSFGKGAFIEALSDFGVPRERLLAIDLDATSETIDSQATSIRGVDFLAWSLSTSERFDRIIGNPPYIPLGRLPTSIRATAAQIPIPTQQTRPNGSSNLWFYFVCASLSLLKHGGNIGFVLPAAWEYADYASPLREHLKHCFQHYYVIRSRAPLFSDVQDGSVVLVAQGYGIASKKAVRVECSDGEGVLRELSSFRSVPAQDRQPLEDTNRPGVRPISNFVHIGIGAVTGHNSYFLMTEDRRKQLSLPVDAMRPVLTRSRQLMYPVFSTREWQSLKKAGERVWLFRPSPRLMHHPAVSRYIELARERGGCNRTAFHVVRRSDWYKTVLPGGVQGFISGMSSIGPWIALNKMSNLTATNTLYTVTFDRTLTLSDRYAVALSLLSTEARDRLDSICRVYPDGLRKHEPKDILSLKLSMPTRRRGVRATYVKAVQELVGGNIVAATKIADSFIYSRLKSVYRLATTQKRGR